MIKLKTLDITVGIYDSTAVITRHRDNTVTLKLPYVKWVGNTGVLAFEKIKFTESHEFEVLSNDIFMDNPTMNLAEFLSYSLTYQRSKN